MLNKKLVSAAVAATFLSGLGATAVQATEVSGNVALVSDYRFRGISQSETDPAIQGGFDVAFAPGFYLGTWGSSIDFDANDNDTGSYGNLELDYYGGWSGPIGDTDIGIDVGYAYYDYPSDTVDPKGDYQEFYVKPSWNGFKLTVAYSDDYYAETGEFWYFGGDYSYTFLEDFSLGLHAGYNSFDETGFLSNDKDDYTDYSISLGYSVMGVDLSIAWVGTDLNEEDYFDTDLADDAAVFTIKKVL